MAFYNNGTTNIPGEDFGNQTPGERAFRVAEDRRLNPSMVRPAPAFRTGGAQPGANVAAPTSGDTGGLGGAFRQPGQSMMPPTGEAIPQSEGGGVIGGNLAAANAPAPAATPEVIRGTTIGAGNVHPSWQLYHNAGQGDQYAGAVQAFRRSQGEGALRQQENEANRAAELEKTRMQGEAHVAGSTAAARGPLYDAQKAVADEQAKGLVTTNQKAQATQHVTDFQNWLTQSPYATFKDGKLEYKSKDEHMERDRIAAESIAKTQGIDAAKQHFEDRQAIRRWLVTQPLPSGFDANVYINELSANPQLWQQLVTQAHQLPPATTKPSGWGRWLTPPGVTGTGLGQPATPVPVGRNLSPAAGTIPEPDLTGFR